MDSSWVEKILKGFIVLGVLVVAILRAGAGTAAVAALGHIPMSMIPRRLRHFVFGERHAPHESHRADTGPDGSNCSG